MAAVPGCLPGQVPGITGLVCAMAGVHRGARLTHRQREKNWKRDQLPVERVYSACTRRGQAAQSAVKDVLFTTFSCLDILQLNNPLLRAYDAHGADLASSRLLSAVRLLLAVNCRR
jgi:hypothetical protein